MSRGLPLLAMALVAMLFFAMGGQRFVTVEALVRQAGALRTAVAAHPITAPACFMALYAACVACMIPIGVLLSIAAGLLFGTLAGTAFVLMAVPLGSLVLVWVARAALRPLLERRGGAGLHRIVAAIERDGFLYLLAARLLPFAPFWLTNLAAAMTRLGLPSFVLATVIGIAPITVVLAATGAGVAETLDAGGTPNLSSLLRPQVTVPLLLTAALALAPVVIRRRYVGRKSGTER